MSRLLEFFLGSILIAVFTVALMFFSALQYILREGNINDCAWYASARTWIDSNGDGMVDRDEPPLAGVEIHVNDIGNQLLNAGWPAVTHRDGEARLYVSIPGCEATVFEVYAEIPAGYHLTTTARLEVNSDAWEGLGQERVYYFGFLPDP